MSDLLGLKNHSSEVFRKILVNIQGGKSKDDQKRYTVEELQNGIILEIRKPGFKGINDFQVWAIDDEEEWRPTFTNMLRIFSSFIDKNKAEFQEFYHDNICEVFRGKDPEELQYSNREIDGVSLEFMLKVLKWWFGEEDCNYPMSEGYQGRKMIMYRIREMLDGTSLDKVIERAEVKRSPPPPNLPNVDYEQVDNIV